MGEEYIRKVMVLGEVPSLGPVLLFDDIEKLLKFTKGGTGGDSVLEASATVAYNGDKSLHLETRTTAGAEDDVEYGYRDLYQRPGKRYAVECIFRFEAAAATKGITFRLEVWDGDTQHYLGVHFYPLANLWQYIASGDTLTNIPGGAQSLAAVAWHRLRFEFDLENDKYLKLIADDMEIDMSALTWETNGSAAAQYVRFKFQLTAGASPPADAYCDDLLITEI